MDGPEVGDRVAVTVLEARYARYAAFCAARSIAPAPFQTWIAVDGGHKPGWDIRSVGIGSFRQEFIPYYTQPSNDDASDIRSIIRAR